MRQTVMLYTPGSTAAVRTERTARALALLTLLLFFAMCAYVAWIYPISKDDWYFTPGMVADRNPFTFYATWYMTWNPRIGEVAFYMGSASQLARAITLIASTVAACLASFVCCSGRLPRFAAADITACLVILAVWALFAPELGTLLFYLPFNANYVLGFALLALAVAILVWRLHRGHGGPWVNIAMFSSAVVAGLSNEHTPPSVLAVVLFLAAISWLKKPPKLEVSPLLTFAAGLGVGFAALFFAPGLNARGEGDKLSALDRPIDELLYAFTEPVIGMALNAWPAFVVVVVSIIVLGWNRALEGRTLALIMSISASAVALMIMVTTVASPIVAPRLEFAAYAALGVAVAASLLPTLKAFPLATALTCVACVAALTPLSLGSIKWGRMLASDYARMEDAASRQLAEGKQDLLLPAPRRHEDIDPYFAVIDSALGRPDPSSFRNKQVAAHFGAKSAAFAQPE